MQSEALVQIVVALAGPDFFILLIREIANAEANSNCVCLLFVFSIPARRTVVQPACLGIAPSSYFRSRLDTLLAQRPRILRIFKTNLNKKV